MKNKLNLRTEVDLQCLSKYISIVVRNAMEDFHHRHLSDKQMKELNPIIRNAVFTALYAYELRNTSAKANQYVGRHLAQIPEYWENPELLPGFETHSKN